MLNKEKYQGNYLELSATYSPVFSKKTAETYLKYKLKQFKGLFSEETCNIQVKIGYKESDQIVFNNVILDAKNINKFILDLFKISSNVRIADHVLGNYIIYTGNKITAEKDGDDYKFIINKNDKVLHTFKKFENLITYVLMIYKKICYIKEEELIEYGFKPNSILNPDNIIR